MKKWIVVIFCIFLFGVTLLSSYADSDWTRIALWTLSGNQISTSYDVLINGNLTVNGTFVNATTIDYVITGSINSTDWSNVTIAKSQISDWETISLWNETENNYIEPVNATIAEVESVNITNVYARNGNITRWI